MARKAIGTRRRDDKVFDPSKPLPDTKQELFCVLYTSNRTMHFFGHGRNSYAFAYGFQKRLDEIDEKMPTASTNTGRGKNKKSSEYSKLEAERRKIHNVCGACGARLLIDARIKARCDFLMDQLAEHAIVDRELLYTIQQRHDLTSKVQAIKHHDQREARVREKVDLKHEFVPIVGFEYVKPNESNNID